PSRGARRRRSVDRRGGGGLARPRPPGPRLSARDPRCSGAAGTLRAMDPSSPREAEAFREKVQAFLAEHLPPDWQGIGALGRDDAVTFRKEWRATLAEHGLLAPAWPKEYGGGGLTP